VLVEALPSLDRFRALQDRIQVPLVCNQIAGGKTPPWSLPELGSAKVGVVIYSTPCLFAAHAAIDRAMVQLRESNGHLQAVQSGVTLTQCTAALTANLRRDVSVR
jgi:2-methylisocitrate lyase-like PEP mutase family enzyme